MMWSRIQDTELATEAYLLMVENEINGCQYHNNSHIEAMYQYLEDTNETYNVVLDWAIMFHDVVYDEKPEKELRSAELFVKLLKDNRSDYGLYLSQVDDIYNLIINTADHLCKGYHNSSAIIRADLHALTSKVDTINNFTKIMDESMTLYDCSVEDFAKNNVRFMNGLHQTMEINILNASEDEKEFFRKVQDGIDLTIRLAKAIKDN